MANFIEQPWGRYNIRLRPSDPVRALMGSFDLDAWILYFNSSDIYFDLVVTMPDDALHKNLDDVVGFEWVLCDKNNEPIQNKTFSGFSFYETFGNGEIPIVTDKKKAKALIARGEISKFGKKNRIIGIRKKHALYIGRLTKATEYNIIMRFRGKNGNNSEYVPMANYSVFIRDRFMHAIILGSIAVTAAALVALILGTCDISF